MHPHPTRRSLFAHDVPPCLRVPRGRDQEVTPVARQARRRVLDRPPSRTMTADQHSLGVGWVERSDTHRHQPCASLHRMMRKRRSFPSLPRERERAVGREGRSEARPGWGPFLAPPPDTPFAFAHDVPPSPRVPRGRDQEVGCGLPRGHAPRRRGIQYAVTPRWSFPSLPRERERAVGREGRSEARPGWGPFLAPPPDTPFAFAHDVPPCLRVPRGRDQEVTPAA